MGGLALQYHSCRRSCLVARNMLGSAVGDMRPKRVAASFSPPSVISSTRITSHIRFDTTLLPAAHTLTRRQECYDDAMNSANEHGIIHPDACSASPIAELNELPEESSVCMTSKNHVNVPGNDAALSSSPTNQHQSTQLAEKGVSPDIEPALLSALEDIFEVARPEIAASAVVAGVCKVRYWMTGVKGGIRRGWIVWYGEEFSNLSYLETIRYPCVMECVLGWWARRIFVESILLCPSRRSGGLGLLASMMCNPVHGTFGVIRIAC